jgi:hypothetical protein
MESHDQKLETKGTTNQERSQNGKTADNRQCAAKPYHIVDLAHVEYSSQPTLRRKRLHHDFMHDLSKQTNRLANKYGVFTVTYVVDNQPRRVGIWVWIVTNVIHGTNAWKYTINHRHPIEKTEQRTLIQSIGLVSIHVFYLDAVTGD